MERASWEIMNEAIDNRRSTYTKQFEPDEKIDDEIVWQIMRNANRAPTHKLTQPWRFTVFTGEGLKKLAQLQVKLVTKIKPDLPEGKLRKLSEKPLKASHIIAITLKRHPGLVPEIEEILAVGCAIENMYLTANAYGVGCYFSTGGITYLEEAKEFFGLSANDKLIGFFYIGKKKEMPDIKTTRGNVEEKVTWIRE